MLVTLVHDPSGLFREGAEFRALDWSTSMHLGRWAEGSEWRWRSNGRAYGVRVVGDTAVREDGAVLRTRLTTYEWVRG